jgi:hypothetical protein
MQTLPTDYSHQQLVDALIAQFVQLQEDDVDGEMGSAEDYTSYLQQLTHSQLIDETGCDDEFLTINDFMYAFG